MGKLVHWEKCKQGSLTPRRFRRRFSIFCGNCLKINNCQRNSSQVSTVTWAGSQFSASHPVPPRSISSLPWGFWWLERGLRWSLSFMVCLDFSIVLKLTEKLSIGLAICLRGQECSLPSLMPWARFLERTRWKKRTVPHKLSLTSTHTLWYLATPPGNK